MLLTNINFVNVLVFLHTVVKSNALKLILHENSIICMLYVYPKLSLCQRVVSPHLLLFYCVTIAEHYVGHACEKCDSFKGCTNKARDMQTL